MNEKKEYSEEILLEYGDKFPLDKFKKLEKDNKENEDIYNIILYVDPYCDSCIENYIVVERIAIMRAIINKPQILLADEPTGNLDKENSQTIMNLFERLNKQGMTIVMVTHDTSLAKYGTRVVRVEDGRIIEKGKEILK